MGALLRTLIPFCLLLSIGMATSAGAQQGTIRFLHFNDSYRIVPVRGLGGFAELSTLINRQRAEAAQAGWPTVLTHGGDLISPSLMSGLTKGKQMIELVNLLGLNIAVLGNHEFDHGADILRQRMTESQFPWLAANVVGPDGKPFGSATATAVAQIGKFKVGFFGVVTPEARLYIRGSIPVTFKPFLQTAKAAVALLKQRQVDIIVAVTHMDIEQDVTLARQVKGVHLVLGGHEHIPIQFLIGSTLILKAGTNAEYLGIVDLAIAKSGNRVKVVPSWRLIAVRGVPPDPKVKAVVDRYVGAMDKRLGGVIGRTATELDSRSSAVRAREAAIGNLIADALVAATGADVALVNGGGIRGDTVYKAGQDLTAKDILTELPFNNSVLVLETPGKTILAALEHGLSKVGSQQGRFPHVAGMQVLFDPSRPPGKRVRSVTIGGKPIDPEATYKLATNAFLAGGGDGYGMFRDLKRLVTEANGPAMTNTVIDYIKSRKTVAPKVEGRMKAMP